MRQALLALLLVLPGLAQDLTKLPAWAQPVAAEAQGKTAPGDPDAWVLLDRTEFAYVGSGEIKQRHFRLVKVLTEAGIAEATYVLHGLGGKASKVKRIKGWNLRPDGELVKLDSDEVVTFDTDDGDSLTTHVGTGAVLDRVQRGSLVAFESLETTKHPLGPFAVASVLEGNPIRRWELIPAVSGGWFTNLKDVKTRMELRHASPWIPPQPGITPEALRLEDLPALPKGESSHPHPRNATPWVSLAFLDPALPGVPNLESWDGLAKWFSAQYQAKALALKSLPPTSGDPGPARLPELGRWISREITYRQVYLSPERGWVPESSEEVVRKRYGDCKDLTCCLLGGASALGLQGYPALARIEEGDIEADEPVGIYAFNHVISAVKLPASLGLPAEVETPRGRFLLVDPTARYTPFGWLPTPHRGRRVMICTPEGALWVQVPDRALEACHVRIEVDGTAGGDNRLEGTYTFIETGDYLGLRSLCHASGAKAVKDRIASLWDFPPTASLEITGGTPDPLDLTVPFKLKVKVKGLPILLPDMGSWSLNTIGFPSIPGPIQRVGRPRVYPVWSRPEPGAWEVAVHLVLATPLKPTTRQLDLDTPFRTLSGQCKVAGGSLEVLMTQTRKAASFTFDQREEGVKQAKHDRSQTREAMDTFLSFTSQP